MVPAVTLALLKEEEEDDDDGEEDEEDESEAEEPTEGKSLAVKILAYWACWVLLQLPPRLNPRPSSSSDSSGQEESSDEKTRLSSLDTVDIDPLVAPPLLSPTTPSMEETTTGRDSDR